MAFRKDPDAILDFSWDWSEWLEVNDDRIVSFEIEVDGVTLEADPAPATDGSVVTAWFSGGTAGTRATATCHIVTNAGREDDRTMTIVIRER